MATAIPFTGGRSVAARRLRETLIERGIQVTAWGAIAIVFLIFVFVAREAAPLFWEPASLEEVGGMRKVFLPQAYGTPEAPLPYVWQPISVMPKYSLLPLLLGTLKVTLVAMVFAVPVAILAAVYTSEYAPRKLRELIKPGVELLAGFPSVVLGFFALIVLATWLQDFFGLEFRLNAINAGIGLGLAVLPIIYTVSEDALSSVPQKFREAALALGASPSQTAWGVVLPTALPGIFAGVILGFGRAIGETMIVLMASGNAAITSLALAEPVRTMSATVAAELAEVVFGSPHWRVLFFVGSLLFLFTLALNSAGAWLTGYLRRLGMA